MPLHSLKSAVQSLPTRLTTPAATARIRGRALQRIRRQHLSAQPLCAGPDSQCQASALVSLATELDHIVALVNGGSESDANRQGLCSTCHRAKTERDLRIAASGQAA